MMYSLYRQDSHIFPFLTSTGAATSWQMAYPKQEYDWTEVPGKLQKKEMGIYIFHA
jgi:hypothetical protein